MIVFGFRRLVRRGRKTIASPSRLTSSASPGRKPSLCRNGLGNTTCPLLETLVSMVRQSYLTGATETIQIRHMIVTTDGHAWARVVAGVQTVLSPSFGPSVHHGNALTKFL